MAINEYDARTDEMIESGELDAVHHSNMTGDMTPDQNRDNMGHEKYDAHVKAGRIGTFHNAPLGRGPSFLGSNGQGIRIDTYLFYLFISAIVSIPLYLLWLVFSQPIWDLMVKLGFV